VSPTGILVKVIARINVGVEVLREFSGYFLADFRLANVG
jgi:hypothetical protein